VIIWRSTPETDVFGDALDLKWPKAAGPLCVFGFLKFFFKIYIYCFFLTRMQKMFFSLLMDAIEPLPQVRTCFAAALGPARGSAGAVRRAHGSRW
jgi:hypothetical protein